MSFRASHNHLQDLFFKRDSKRDSSILFIYVKPDGNHVPDDDNIYIQFADKDAALAFRRKLKKPLTDVSDLTEGAKREGSDAYSITKLQSDLVVLATQDCNSIFGKGTGEAIFGILDLVQASQVDDAIRKLDQLDVPVLSIALAVLGNSVNKDFKDEDYKRLVSKADPVAVTAMALKDEFLAQAAKRSPQVFAALLAKLDAEKVASFLHTHLKDLLVTITEVCLYQPLENIAAFHKIVQAATAMQQFQPSSVRKYWKENSDFCRAAYALYEKLESQGDATLRADLAVDKHIVFGYFVKDIQDHINCKQLQLAQEEKQDLTDSAQNLVANYVDGNLLVRLDSTHADWVSVCKQLQDRAPVTPHTVTFLSKYGHTKLSHPTGYKQPMVGALFLKDKSIVKTTVLPQVEEKTFQAFVDENPHTANFATAEFQVGSLVGLIVGEDQDKGEVLSRALARDRKNDLRTQSVNHDLPILSHSDLTHEIEIYSQADQNKDQAKLLADLTTLEKNLFDHQWKVGLFGGTRVAQKNKEGYEISGKTKVPAGIAECLEIIHTARHKPEELSLSDALLKIKEICDRVNIPSSSGRDQDTEDQYKAIPKYLGLTK